MKSSTIKKGDDKLLEKKSEEPQVAKTKPGTSMAKMVSNKLSGHKSSSGSLIKLNKPQEGLHSVDAQLPTSSKSVAQKSRLERSFPLHNIKKDEDKDITLGYLERRAALCIADGSKTDLAEETAKYGWRRFNTTKSLKRQSASTDHVQDDDYDSTFARQIFDREGWSKREKWESHLTYLIALVMYSISLSNIYHFPSLVYHYGGMPFLIPYTIFTIVLGYPIHFLESTLGQYSQSGPVRVWDCAPIARGLGWSMFLICLGVAYYHNIYAAYSMVYLFGCFNKILPWEDCDAPEDLQTNFSCVPRMCARKSQNIYTPAEHYFFDRLLKIQYTEKILDNGLGPMVWNQVLGFFLAWICVYIVIIQGVRSIGKVVVFMVILPYFILFMLLSAGLLLKGSSRGLQMLVETNFHRLVDIQIWRSAAEEVFFELGISQGVPLAYGSYCRHSNPTYYDSAIVCFINYFTSILCAVVIFCILGALSLEIGVPITQVIRHDPSSVFIAYPEALSRIPGSQFWCFSFFLMLFSVVIGKQIAIMETLLTVVYDEFYKIRPYRWLINFIFCSCLFISGIILCTSNGYYLVYLLERMTTAMPSLPIAACMVGTIVLIYGLTKYCEDMHFMLNYYPNIFIKICFLIIPFLLVALTIYSWIFIKPLSVRGKEFVMDAIAVGWFTIWFILISIVLGAFYWIGYCIYRGKLKYVFRSVNS